MLLEALETERLPYFWHPHCNLFDKIDRVTLRDYAFRLRRLMLKTETGENPLFLSDLVCKYINTKHRYLIALQNYYSNCYCYFSVTPNESEFFMKNVINYTRKN